MCSQTCICSSRRAGARPALDRGEQKKDKENMYESRSKFRILGAGGGEQEQKQNMFKETRRKTRNSLRRGGKLPEAVG